jgi:DNA-binding CsgD family transcriptional regulator
LNIADAASRIRARLQSLTNGLTFQTLPANLSRREAEVLQLVARSKSNRQIARELMLSESTVANHLSHIFAKTRSENRVAATTFAIRHNLV